MATAGLSKKLRDEVQAHYIIATDLAKPKFCLLFPSAYAMRWFITAIIFSVSFCTAA